MKKAYIVFTAALLALISLAVAQNPIDAVAGSLQEQMNVAGEQLQQKAVQHIAEGNLTREHITQDLNATTENLTEKAKLQLEQKINQDLNITPEELEQKAKEELMDQLNQRINQQPGFPAALAVLIVLLAGCLIKRRN
jgi:predicted Co/Zn/Cd cation transporter (cation efflux family)